MTYYTKDQYKERYYAEFMDLEGALWHVSIEDPTFTGTATELTAGDEPLEWMGDGDDDQTNSIYGSTGTLRLVCLSGEEDIYKPGALMPEAVNDRRVTVTRGGVHMWQGFIKCEQYDQDWVSAPYEVELPIMSALAATEYFTMPAWDKSLGTDYTCVYDVFYLIAQNLGCDINYLCTNQPTYLDYNGETQETESGATAQWIQGFVGMSAFYDFGETGIEPKTMKEVLEVILGPYGHLHECQKNWYVMLDRYQSDEYIYYIMLDEKSDVNTFTQSTGTFPSLDMTDLTICSTENTKTILPAPSSVTYSRSIDNTSEVFSLSKKMIKPAYSPTMDDITTYQDDAKNVMLVNVPKNYIDKTLFTYEPSNYTTSSCTRFFKVEYDKDKKEYTYSDVAELSLRLTKSRPFNITPTKGVRTRQGYSKLKLTITAYAPESKYDEATIESTGVYLRVKVVDNGKYLYKTDDDKYKWQDSENWLIPIQDFKEDTNSYYVDFYDSREVDESGSTDDNSLHNITIYFELVQVLAVSDPTILVVPKLEYIEDTLYTDAHTLLRAIEGVKYNQRTVSVGGNGSEVGVEFKTMCGQYFDSIDGAADIPYNSVCDEVGLIDTGQRTMLELSAVRYDDDQTELVNNFCYINDGTTHYIPVATGMNARNCTTQLRLISTNNS